jgi:hypothetical protein
MSLMIIGAEQKPTLLCAGYLAGFGKLARSSKEGSSYCWLPFDIAGIHGSRNAKGKLFFTPEFFERHISEKTLRARHGREAGDKLIFSYKKNVASKDSVGILQALCGGVENFGKFSDYMGETLGVTPDEEEVANAIIGFFDELGPQTFGFVQKQRKSWDGVSYRTDADGELVKTKKGQPIREYSREAYYDIDSFFFLTKSRLKSLVGMVEKNNANIADPEWREKYPEVEEMKFTFDLSQYDVEAPAEPELVETA